MLPFFQIESSWIGSTDHYALADGLGVEPDLALAKFCRVLHWSMLHETGRFVGRSALRQVADAAGWAGDPEVFRRACVEAGILEVVDDGLEIRGWEKRYRKLLVEREREAERKREARRRTSPGHPPDVHPDIHPDVRADGGPESAGKTQTQTLKSSECLSNTHSAVDEGDRPEPVAGEGVIEFIEFFDQERRSAAELEPQLLGVKGIELVETWYLDARMKRGFPDWALRKAASGFLRAKWSRGKAPDGTQRDASLLLFIQDQCWLTYMPREFLPRYDRPLTGEAYG